MEQVSKKPLIDLLILSGEAVRLLWLKIIGGTISDELGNNDATLIGGTHDNHSVHLESEDYITITDSEDFNSSQESKFFDQK